MAPPNSFIHAEDFKSPEELVKYLDYLDGNDTAYLEYHAWRNMSPPDDNKDEMPQAGFQTDALNSVFDWLILRKCLFDRLRA